jgi:beta-lactamase class A
VKRRGEPVIGPVTSPDVPNDAGTDRVHAAVRGAHVSVAARDLRTGAVLSYGPGERYLAASVAKIAILAVLLVQARAEGRPLTGRERDLAARMIRVSDNDAAHELWNRTGRDAAMDGVLRAFGLTETRTTPESWGLTRTSAADQVRLVAALAGDASDVLDQERRAYVLDLMAGVAADQRWGIEAVARPGERLEVKDGWLDYSGHDGRWTVNSVGRISGDGRDLVLAVLSDDHATLDDGLAVVERAAVAAAGVVRDG